MAGEWLESALPLDPGRLVEFGRLADAGSGLLFLILGGAVAAIRPHRRVNTAFAVFACAFGLAWLLANLPFLQGARAELYSILALVPLATAALLVVAREFPGPLSPSARRAQRLLVAASAAALALSLVVAPRGLPFGATGVEGHVFRLVYGSFFTIGLGALLATLALRWNGPAHERDARDERLALLATVAFLPYLALAGGIHATALAAGVPGALAPYSFTAAGILPLLALVVTLWLRASALRRGPEARTARNVALAAAGLTTFGAVFAVLFGPANGPNNLGLLGLSRAWGIAVLAYAILKHQLLGIDVKVRWGISRTTIAASFIAVFFVVSEIAQQFFGDTLGSAYVGILAAGALVFAIAPLSRLADRLAERALPPAASIPDAGARGDELYRSMLRLALADRRLTDDEELDLAELAGRLGLDPRRTLEIRREIERERLA